MDLAETKNQWGGTLSNYVKGLTASFILTSISFSLVGSQLFSNWILAVTITFLALVQAAIQLIYFLHVAHEKQPRWRIHFFYCMVGVLIIIAVGTLWIMHNLNDRVMGHMSKEMHHD